ncbi:unnamed protein product [Protopolystoma xenopodis]|uniref:Uncharacterized protein n=1 Tax=Protopolystoma xenopodis TaxID=117903 RepID=A0A448WLQ2_9PLAT|nr:unnamed protein product [Protopolystoma xenopodis]
MIYFLFYTSFFYPFISPSLHVNQLRLYAVFLRRLIAENQEFRIFEPTNEALEEARQEVLLKRSKAAARPTPTDTGPAQTEDESATRVVFTSVADSESTSTAEAARIDPLDRV